MRSFCSRLTALPQLYTTTVNHSFPSRARWHQPPSSPTSATIVAQAPVRLCLKHRPFNLLNQDHHHTLQLDPTLGSRLQLDMQTVIPCRQVHSNRSSCPRHPQYQLNHQCYHRYNVLRACLRDQGQMRKDLRELRDRLPVLC